MPRVLRRHGPLTLAFALALWATLPAAGATGLNLAETPAGPSFEELSRQAAETLAAGRLDEALAAYRAGVERNPQWSDGWWQLALIHFDAERFSESREALNRLVALEPETGPAWALLGFSEYRLANYDQALAALSRAVALGLPEGQALSMSREAQHHLALLLVRRGEFGMASRSLSRLVTLEPDDPELVAACGLMALRIARLPSEVPADAHDLVMTAGRATHDALAYKKDAAQRGYEELVTRFPTTRGVHYIAGLFLSRIAAERALTLLKKEVELFPDHAEAQLEVALQTLDRANPADALPYAREAVRLAPAVFLSHLALGRALLENGAVAEALVELGEAERLGPESTEVCLALAQAYARAGRDADVQRVRARLTELFAKREGARQQ